MNDKITDKHLERAAYVYIRQSTLQQVRHNQESNRRQYALQDRARDLGFETVFVIDDDLGISGAGTEQRPALAGCSQPFAMEKSAGCSPWKPQGWHATTVTGIT